MFHFASNKRLQVHKRSPDTKGLPLRMHSSLRRMIIAAMGHSLRTHTGKKKPSKVLTTTVSIHQMHQSIEPSVQQDDCAVQQGVERRCIVQAILWCHLQLNYNPFVSYVPWAVRATPKVIPCLRPMVSNCGDDALEVLSSKW